MKRITILTLVVFVVSAPAFGQNGKTVDDLLKAGMASVSAKAEKDRLARASKGYNTDQGEFPFKNASFDIQIAEDDVDYRNLKSADKQMIRASVGQQLTARGAKWMWDRREIEKESKDRDAYEKNKHVKKTDWLGQPTIELPENILKLSFLSAEKREDAELRFGSWWRGINFRFGRETVYFGIVARVIDRRSGACQHTYKVLVSASDADNVGGRIVDGFYGASGSYKGNSRESLRMRARESAIKELGNVFSYMDAS